MKKLLFILPLAVLLCSCKQEIIIDLEEGQPLIGVDASFTDEYKRHEVVLSYTSDFYHSGDVKMVSGAEVSITDGNDTIFFAEDVDNVGHYYTIDSVAGTKCRNYRLLINVPDETREDGFIHLFAESYMPDNVETVDSIAVRPYVAQGLPMEIICVYPYFQSLPDPSIVYLIMTEKNDTLLTDTISEYMSIPMGGYAGYYVNGPEMLQNNMEIPVGYFSPKDLRNEDRIKAYFYSIPVDYMYYIYSVTSSSGSNPMMGSPSNVITNIQPKGEGVGWFYAASVVSAETVYVADSIRSQMP